MSKSVTPFSTKQLAAATKASRLAAKKLDAKQRAQLMAQRHN